MTLVLGIAAFGGGLWLLVESVEGLVETLSRWAAAAGLSGIVVSALVLGFDLESTASGVAATLRDLPGTALGTCVGAAIFLVTAGIGLAALTAPFEVRTPPQMLGAAGLASVLAAVLLLDGTLSRVDGAILVAAFGPLVALVLRARTVGAEPPSGEPPDRLPLRILLGLGGLVAGAELLVFGTDRIVHELDLSETVFGLLVVAAAVSFEEVVLEMLPAHRGKPEISVGNALGTLLFLLTASLGIVALARPVEAPDAVPSYHVPALLLAVGVLNGLLVRGRMGRPEGTLLLAAYAAYATGAVLVA